MNGFFEWFQHWAEQIIALVESMKEWFDHFFGAEEEVEETTTQG